MPVIGIIWGRGESFNATRWIIKLIQAINTRFRDKIQIIEVPLGNRRFYGSDLSLDTLNIIKKCDVLISCDMSTMLDELEYSNDEIAFALGDYVKNLHIKGSGKFSMVDVCVSSYFDGGAQLREFSQTVDGCIETRVCSSTEAMNVAKSICKISEHRRRRMYFVKDGENEFFANMFYRYFLDYILPKSNFHLYNYSIFELINEIFICPEQFDTIFASKSSMDCIYSIYKNILGRDFAAYFTYGDAFRIYEVKSLCSNVDFNKETPSLVSYIHALADILIECFQMQKEYVHLKNSLDKVIEAGYKCENSAEFISKLKEELKKPVRTRFK